MQGPIRIKAKDLQFLEYNLVIFIFTKTILI
jgi:hypothetical protein